MPDKNRLGALDALRGLAALWVALYHFCVNWQSEYQFPSAGLLTWLAEYGYLAVYLFFVISGFVIPFSLDRSKYQLGDYGRFLLKRVIRLHPLFLVSVGVCAWFMTLPNGWSDLWPHFFYLNDILGRNWYLDIFWTLALEIQYALAIPLLFPLLIHTKRWVRYGTLLAFLIPALVWKSPVWFTHYAGFYALGILAFWKFSGRESWPVVLAGIVLCSFTILESHGTKHLTMGLVATAVIFFGRSSNRILSWLAKVSYPFYLLHIMVGHQILMAAVAKERNVWWDSLWILAAIGASLIVAEILHRFVEVPSQRWAAAIKYRKRQ